MSDIRLFVSDIDGTLVHKDKSLPDANVAAAHRLVEAGVAMSLISARPPSGMLWIARKIGLPGPFAAFNGGTLFDADGTIRSAQHLDDDLAAECFAMFEGQIDYWAFAHGIWYAHSTDGEHADHERLAANMEPEVRADFSALAHEVDKVVGVCDDPVLLSKFENEARRRFGNRANVVRSQTYYLDITAPTANKGDGIAALAQAYGVPLDQVAVAGDMNNDLPMFERAGLSIVMGQAPSEVRQAASMVVASNDEEGVAKAIDRLLASL